MRPTCRICERHHGCVEPIHHPEARPQHPSLLHLHMTSPAAAGLQQRHGRSVRSVQQQPCRYVAQHTVHDAQRQRRLVRRVLLQLQVAQHARARAGPAGGDQL